MLESRTYHIAGRVQGVGFRWFTHDAASREGLVGVVRNEPDGGVEVIVEGDRLALDRFEGAIRRGPTGARVDAVEREIGPASGYYADFSIRG
ncbi:MAG: acylphosphatase [Acidobacteria bacterium]|nr:acylphosphatase [Acidobacteriota bacterium]